jgi:DNA (cytosine-5)-methyltransferase 1
MIEEWFFHVHWTIDGIRWMAKDRIKSALITSPERSDLMRKVRRTNTAPEIEARRVLRELGIHYSLRGKGLPGTPDILNKGEQWAIFVNGCFWHQHQGCVRSRLPKSNLQFWEPKLKGNAIRDSRKKRDLESVGFRVLVIWECELQDQRSLEAKIIDFMKRRNIDHLKNDMNASLFESTPPHFDYKIEIEREISRYLTVSGQGKYESRLPIPSSVPRDDLESLYDYAWLRQSEAPKVPSEERPCIRSIDLFSGCGGLSLGIREACSFFGRSHKIELALDMNHDAMNVYKDNFDPIRYFENDVRKYFPVTSRSNVMRGKKINSLLDDLQMETIDLLVAGPPCQGFSDLNNHTRRDDPRNDLYMCVAYAALAMKPKVVIIENVPAVRYDNDERVRRTVDILTSDGYDVDCGLVDLSMIGVPQIRKRHVLLATKGCKFILSDIIGKYTSKAKRTVKWAIADLANKKEDRFLYRSAKMSEDNIRRIEYLTDNDLYDLPNTERPDCHKEGEHSYKSMYGRLRWDAPAQTITGGFFSPGQGRYIHPKAARTILPREAARFQFFPDYFSFDSAGTRTSLAQMIGNAVPMKLSFVITCEMLLKGVFR